ncbi:TIGR00341 family protein [Gracilimonas mengyeensis]|uniref:TIGR00341 family protein n=1 Tax=Gracilimonas mengyeensis TaxID=1302730 RepID=A0A521D4D1_9BACT|nr:TIGR00341 family protein [Gracilimonas mengyeensis]SMO66534.1 TIGR00341 family protein [Gracilimonas mengyeensis]
MALRLVKILPPEGFEDFESLINEEDIVDSWIDKSEDGGKTSINLLADVGLTEKILGELETKFSGKDDYRVILLPISATLPSQSDEEEEEKSADKENDEKIHRISRDELYSEINKISDFSWVYLVLIALSCVVAANGLIRDSAAMVIGAMVIAPILGPNVGLALATTLGDKSLLKRSFKSIFFGFTLGISLSYLMGLLIDFNPEVSQINSRTVVSYADIALGLAAGVAGCLSFTRGISAAVIGVMVAVALLPPMVATGLLLGSGMYKLAYGAGLLTLTYIICINLAGVVTFLLQGIKPHSFVEQREGEELSRYAIFIWVALLIGLSVIIYFEFL